VEPSCTIGARLRENVNVKLRGGRIAVKTASYAMFQIEPGLIQNIIELKLDLQRMLIM
jgi:hypothetical protein